MLGGGGVGVFPRMRSITHTPRITGEVLVPLAVTLSTLPWDRNPPLGEPAGSFTLRISIPVTPGTS